MLSVGTCRLQKLCSQRARQCRDVSKSAIKNAWDIDVWLDADEDTIQTFVRERCPYA